MATCEEMKQDLAPFALHDAAAKSKGGPVLLRDGDTVYTDPSDSHSLIVGDTGSMKTLRFVLPLIYSCAAADESMVIVEPVMRERFGREPVFCPEDAEHFHFDVPICVSQQFFGWVCGFGGKVEVTAPAAVRAQLHEMVQGLAEQHE